MKIFEIFENFVISDFWEIIGENVRSLQSDKILSVFSHVGKGVEKIKIKKKKKKKKKKKIRIPRNA